tara:strand:+ start:243 stop:479 length:237 start_codon:yes stop_codon:yes gene_type:complete
MITYNDDNIKKLVSLIEKYGKRSKSNLVWRGSKLNINESQVLNAIKLLIDLKVIIEKKEMIGDGWNNRDTCKFYYLAQ